MSATAPYRAIPSSAIRRRGIFIAGLGIGQIVSWGSLYYSFPLIAGPMGQDLALSKLEIYGAATCGLVIGSLADLSDRRRDRSRARQAHHDLRLRGWRAAVVAWSQIASLWSFYLLFAGIGLVQAMTLYEPAFAIVVRRYGTDARTGVTALTLWGGFASTVFVPLIQFLLDHVGWRDTVLMLGLINLGLCAALHLAVIDPKADAPDPATSSTRGDGAPPVRRHVLRWALRQPVFWGLLVSFTVTVTGNEAEAAAPPDAPATETASAATAAPASRTRERST